MTKRHVKALMHTGTIAGLVAAAHAGAPAHDPHQRGIADHHVQVVTQADRVSIDVASLRLAGRAPDGLRNPAHAVTLPIGRRGVTLTADRVRTHPAVGVETVFGATEGGGSFLISQSETGATGAIWTASGAYDLINMGETDEHGTPVFEVRPVPRDLPECDGPVIPSDTPPWDEAMERSTREVGDEPDVNVRVLIAFAPDVKNRFNLPSFAAAAIDSTNNAYANSEIGPMRLELAGFIDLPDLPPVRTSAQLLRALTCPYDGVADEAMVLREHLAADAVAWIVDMTGACGRAYVSPTNPNRLLSVTDPDCAIGNLTFAHEVGHNFGAAHDPDNAGSSWAPYGFGHRWNNNQFRSVMAYSPGSRVPHFSNPNITYAGGATGIVNQRDNARVHNITARFLASARTGQGEPFTDCDGSGTDDFLQILLDPSLDLDFDGQIDACQIAADPSLDCDRDGVLDSVQLRPITVARFGPFLNVAPGSPRHFTVPAPLELDSDLVFTVGGAGNFSGTSRFVELVVGEPGHEVIVHVPLNTSSSCSRDGDQRTVTVPMSDVISSLPDIPVQLRVSPNATPTCEWNAISVRVRFESIGEGDSNGSGILDRCECPADVTGPTFDGVPDGNINITDLNYYIGRWLAGHPDADVTGPAFDGLPDGLVNTADLNYYLGLWINTQGACPQ